MLKFARWIGVLASAGTLGLYLILVFFNPYAPTSLTPPIAAMMLLSIAGMIAAVKARPYLMLAVFVMSFVPMGFYMLGTPGMFRWIGIVNLLFLMSGLMILAAEQRGQKQRASRREEP